MLQSAQPAIPCFVYNFAFLPQASVSPLLTSGTANNKGLMSVLRGFLVPSGGWRWRAGLTEQLRVISARGPLCRAPRKSGRGEPRSSGTPRDRVQVLSDGEELAM